MATMNVMTGEALNGSYDYRLVATNDKGTTAGGDAVFTTSDP